MSIDMEAARTTLSDQVAEEIRVLLTRRRMSGRQLAARLGVSPAWISYRLSGKQPIDLNDLAQIAGALGVPVADLLPRSTAQVQPPTGQIGADAGVGRYVPPGIYGHPKSLSDQATPKVAGRTMVSRPGYPDRVRPRDNRPSSHPAVPVVPPTHRRPAPRPRSA